MGFLLPYKYFNNYKLNYIMKRITAITKCKGVLAETLNRKANRIRRAVQQAIDCAEDKAATFMEQAEEIINNLGDKAGASDTPALQDALNEYVTVMNQAKAYSEAATTYRELAVKLEEEVTVEDTEE